MYKLAIIAIAGIAVSAVSMGVAITASARTRRPA